MNKHQQKVPEGAADIIRSGEYFNQARKWYFVLFSNPIAERSFYLITLCIALVTLVLGVLSVRYILPVTQEYPFFVRNYRTDTKVPRIVKLRRDASETQDFALMRFFVRSYVEYRESYGQDMFDVGAKFVARYSDQPVLQAYQQYMSLSNPSSPRLLFSDPWLSRVVEIKSMQMKTDVQPYQALIRFEAYVRGNNTYEPIPFTADIRFLYSPLQAVTELDSVSGENVTRFKQPEFQVVSYNVQQSEAQGLNPGYQQVR